MIISLCGDEKDKKVLINELVNKYGERIVICDYFKLCFNAIIDNEKKKYEMIDGYKNLETARKIYNEYIEKIVTSQINSFFEENKEKIILLISDNILTKDIDETEFFKKSDLKILITSNNEYNNTDYPCSHKVLYNKNSFDYVIYNDERKDIKRLVRL